MLELVVRAAFEPDRGGDLDVFNTVWGDLVADRASRDDLKRVEMDVDRVSVAAQVSWQLNQAINAEKGPNAWMRLLWYAEPRGATLEPGAGALAGEAIWSARVALARKMTTAPVPAPIESMPATPEPSRQAGKSAEWPLPLPQSDGRSLYRLLSSW